MLILVTCHEGRYPRNGGEYGFWEEIFEYQGKIVVEYFTTSEFPYCRIYGRFQECRDCMETDNEGYCLAHYQELTQEELEKLARELEMDLEELIEIIKAKEAYEYDVTGHDYIGCHYDGGCIVCYPCNHAYCLGILREKHDNR